jgi:O-antigen/teichoic acid export membrane protein
MTLSQKTPKAGAASHGIIGKFLHLASAQTIRDLLHTAFFIYLARVNQSNYGEFQLAFNTAMIVLFLGEFGLNQPLVSSLSKKYGNKGDILVQYTLIKGVILVLGWLAVTAFIMQQRYTGGLTNLVQVITAGVGMEALASTFFVACRVKGRQDVEARIRAIGSVVGYGWALGALALGLPPHWIALFKILENSICLVGGAWVTMSKTEMKSLTLNGKALARTWNTAKGGLVFVMLAFFSILYNKANLFFLQKFSGPYAVAQYSATWEVVDAIQIPITSLLMKSVLYPLFVGLWRHNKGEFDRLKDNSVKWLLGASIPVMFFLFIESDRIIGTIYGPSYVQAMWLQKWLVPAVMFSFIHNLAAYLMMSQHRQNALFWIYAAGLALNLILCATLIPHDPLLGAGLAIVLTKGVVALCTVYFCQRNMTLIKWRSVAPVALASAIGAALYFGLGLLGIREIAEAGALAPFGWLAVRWWKDMKAQARGVV